VFFPLAQLLPKWRLKDAERKKGCRGHASVQRGEDNRENSTGTARHSDTTILVDDGSTDDTVRLARTLGLQVFVHDQNYGYGRNQQTCYREALNQGADIVVMVHPDYQYTPLLVTPMASMIAFGVYDVVLGSRILGGGALKGGMPFYKYVANRFLTAFQNALTERSSPNITRDTEPSPETSCRCFPYSKTPTILFLTTKCWRSAFA